MVGASRSGVADVTVLGVEFESDSDYPVPASSDGAR
jgi:hypothetical protein